MARLSRCWQDTVTGQRVNYPTPQPGPPGYIPCPPGRPPKGGTILGATIAADALRYDGATYVYGGNASRVGLWDCSSFVSYVLGHDLKLALPGGRWGGPGMPPGSHGPVVLSYAAWAGSYQVSVPGPGDLCIWAGDGPNGHIGIALGPDRMISALNPQLGTLITQIAGTGPASAPLTYRRLTGAVTTGGPVGYGTGSAPPYLAMAAVAAVAVLLFLAAGAALTWGVAAGARKLRQQPAS